MPAQSRNSTKASHRTTTRTTSRTTSNANHRTQSQAVRKPSNSNARHQTQSQADRKPSNSNANHQTRYQVDPKPSVSNKQPKQPNKLFSPFGNYNQIGNPRILDLSSKLTDQEQQNRQNVFDAESLLKKAISSMRRMRDPPPSGRNYRRVAPTSSS